MTRTLVSTALLAVLLSAPAAFAQSAQSLTVAQIMQDQRTWVGSSPSRPQWSEDGDWLTFRWNPGGAFESDSLYRVPRSGGEPQQLSPDERRSVRATFDGWAHGELVYDHDFGRKVFAEAGDLYLLDRRTGVLERLTQTSARESSPRFAPGGDAIVYRTGEHLYRLDLDSGAVRQLTDLQSGRERPDPKPGERDAWLEAQQKELFDVVRERQRRQELREASAERDRAALGLPPTHRYGDGRIGGLTIDPTERFVAFTVSESGESKGTIAQNYVTDSGYAADLNARPKVGQESTPTRLYLQDLERDTTYRVDFTQLPGAYDVVPAHRADEGVEVDSSTARVLSAGVPSWSADGKYAVLVVTAADQKDRWIASLDPESGDLTVLDRQHDDAWSLVWAGFGATGWLPDNRTYWFLSEASGYAHLYAADVATGTVSQLTRGDFEVHGIHVSRDGETWFLTTSEGSPFDRHLYRMPIAGGERVRLTEGAGSHAATMHPDENGAAVMHSFTTTPPELYLKEFGAPAQRVTESTTPEWRAYPWRTGEIVTIPASDGVQVPAQVFRPENPNGAAVFFVHGAGYLQNVHRWWSSYSREFMFHNLLVDRGYTVLNVDYRASSGYGRDWRTAVYRHMGGRDLQDYVDASTWVGSEYGIDPERVFVYGGSYGGFITLMALFTEAEHFGGGAALRSVTDWAHYNHWYTSAILNTPVTDSLAYARSSPINFAAGLEDPLLMAHGVIDTNVQYQDIIRLVQRLIELGKEDWELASYPVEGHGFREPTSWTDEYSRILKLIEHSVGAQPPGR